MIEFVLDASAVLAFFFREPGGSMVEDCMSSAAITAVNLIEVVGKLIDRGQESEDAIATSSQLDCDVVPLTLQTALRAGALRAETRPWGLSLADRVCLAYAEQARLTVLTADRAWSKVKRDIDVRLIR